uniref:DUF45 domain-containing protein n=1 Tax=Coralloluteibacterium stylophorae TaxID=1776034 RepID=A0A8J7VS26_9GAMM
MIAFRDRRAAETGVRLHVHVNRDWLAAQLLRFAPAGRAQPFAPGDARPLPLRGVELPVAWREGRFVGIRLEADGTLVATAPSGIDATPLRRALLDFYRAQARADVGRWLPRYLDGLPRPPRSIAFKPLSSLWGSLSPSGAVSLDLALVLGPPAAFEYVLVHELCHLIQANHSPAFWQEVEARCPDWREQRRWFHAHGLALKARLAQLLD